MKQQVLCVETGGSVEGGAVLLHHFDFVFCPEGHQSAGVKKAVASCALYLQLVTRGDSVCDGRGVGGSASV